MKQLLIFFPIILLLSGCISNQKSNDLPRVNEYEEGLKTYKNDNAAQAIESFNRWLAKYPNDAEAYIERGRAYNRLQKYKLALKDFTRAIELSSKPASSINPLRPAVYSCGALLSLGQKDDAAKSIELIIDDSKFILLGAYEKFLVYLLDGQLKLEKSDNQKALASLNKALSLFDGSYNQFVQIGSPYINRLALYHRGIAHYRLEMFQEAAEDQEAYIKITQTAKQQVTTKDYKSLALALCMSGEYEKCRKILPKIPASERQELEAIFFTPK